MFSPKDRFHTRSVAASTRRTRRLSLAHPPNLTRTAHSGRTAKTRRPFCPSPLASRRGTRQPQPADSLHDVSHGTAFEGSGFVNIDVPTAPQNLQATSTPGTDFWYTVTAIWLPVAHFDRQAADVIACHFDRQAADVIACLDRLLAIADAHRGHHT